MSVTISRVTASPDDDRDFQFLPVIDPVPQSAKESSSLPLIAAAVILIAFLIFRFGGFTS